MTQERKAKVNEINRLRELIKTSETQMEGIKSSIKNELLHENQFRLKEVISGIDKYKRTKVIIIDFFEASFPIEGEPILLACGHTATKLTGRNEYLKNWSSSTYKIPLTNKVKRKGFYEN